MSLKKSLRELIEDSKSKEDFVRLSSVNHKSRDRLLSRMSKDQISKRSLASQLSNYSQKSQKSVHFED
jgi:hypothetical protein